MQRCPITCYSWQKVRGALFSLGSHKVILESPCLLVLFIYMKHKTKKLNLGLTKWLHFTSLKLCTCSQITHPSPRVASTPNRTKPTTMGLTICKYSTHTKLHHLACDRSEGKLLNLCGNKRKSRAHLHFSFP